MSTASESSSGGRYLDLAGELWEKARVEAEASGERPVLWRILKSLAEVERAHGNADEAQRLWSQARGLVQYIAEHVPGQYRESFLNLAEVREVMEGY